MHFLIPVMQDFPVFFNLVWDVFVLVSMWWILLQLTKDKMCRIETEIENLSKPGIWE